MSHIRRMHDDNVNEHPLMQAFFDKMAKQPKNRWLAGCPGSKSIPLGRLAPRYTGAMGLVQAQQAEMRNCCVSGEECPRAEEEAAVFRVAYRSPVHAG